MSIDFVIGSWELYEPIFFPHPDDIAHFDKDSLQNGHNWSFMIDDAKIILDLSKGPWTIACSNECVHGKWINRKLFKIQMIVFWILQASFLSLIFAISEDSFYQSTIPK